jgi:sugar phosphate isomerase/epimerase
MNTSRRDFLSKAAALSSIAITPLENMFAAAPNIAIPKDFNLIFLATNWGFAGSIDSFCSQVKQDGYVGIEVWWPQNDNEKKELFTALKKHNLSVGFLVGGSDKNPTLHYEQFKKSLEGAAYQQIQQPLYINCHSGRDYFSMEENKPLIDLTTAISEKTGILICHETHRSRMLYAAHVTRKYIENFSKLRLTLDISHWCNVHESLLQDQEETVQLALTRTRHIHCRIGHQQGAQVNDPRAPEWEQAVSKHLEWWDKVITNCVAAEINQMTILTEFGPPNYTPTLPYTHQPIANQWDINLHMKNMLKKRYAKQ